MDKVTIFAESFAQRVDLDLQVLVRDNSGWPRTADELVLGNQLAVAVHQHQQDFERTLAERDRHAVGQQLAPRDLQSERSERQSFGHRLHSGGDGLDSANRSVSRLRPSRRS